MFMFLVNDIQFRKETNLNELNHYTLLMTLNSENDIKCSFQCNGTTDISSKSNKQLNEYSKPILANTLFGQKFAPILAIKIGKTK